MIIQTQNYDDAMALVKAFGAPDVALSYQSQNAPLARVYFIFGRELAIEVQLSSIPDAFGTDYPNAVTLNQPLTF